MTGIQYPKCKNPECENLVKEKYKNEKLGWKKYCSAKCRNAYKGIVARQTNLEKYGVENPMHLDSVKAKIKETCLSKYGVDSINKSSLVKDKKREAYRNKFGVDNPNQSEKIKEKKRQTCLKKYCVENPMQSEVVKEKLKQSIRLKYGVDNVFQSAEIKKKIADNYMSEFGVGHVRHVNLGRDVLDKLNNSDWLISEYEKGGQFGIQETLGICATTAYLYLKKIGCIKNKSNFEEEIAAYIRSIVDTTIIRNNRTTLKNKEIDIFLIDLNIAIECNGSYWHSELQGKDKSYHLNKTNLCKEKDIQLIHIWNHDWLLNNGLVKSRIKSKLGLNDRVYARKCVIQEINSKVTTEFLNNNHIQGNCPASVRYGLYYNKELIAVMTFGKSRYKKDIEYELLRYCSKQGTNVTGGASKLFKKFTREYSPASVISYSDRMWNTGSLYKQLGFEYSHSTDPAYYYTKNYSDFENRLTYQKHKLKDKLDIFNPSLTEWENMQANGYDRIWDCGNDVWLFND